jgi:hypothetical protein
LISNFSAGSQPNSVLSFNSNEEIQAVPIVDPGEVDLTTNALTHVRSNYPTTERVQEILNWLLNGYQIRESEVPDLTLGLFRTRADRNSRLITYQEFQGLTPNQLTTRLNNSSNVNGYLVGYLHPSI